MGGKTEEYVVEYRIVDRNKFLSSYFRHPCTLLKRGNLFMYIIDQKSALSLSGTSL